jgi:predicted RNase H-like HicB family nuclease
MKMLMHRSGYYVVFEREEDGWYVVHAPELPGCISQGADFHDASANITTAIEDYLELAQEVPPVVMTTSAARLVESSTVKDAQIVSD